MSNNYENKTAIQDAVKTEEDLFSKQNLRQRAKYKIMNIISYHLHICY
jgi:hypothetical protein